MCPRNPRDHWLIYGTGGLAWSQARVVETPGIINDADKSLRTRTGWVVGAGTEIAIAPNWTARLEYLYDRFGSVTGTFPSGTRYESAFDIHMLRLGLNYKLAWPDAKPTAIKTQDAWSIPPDSWNVHAQMTLIGQGYPAFRSPYEGQNSLSGAAQFKIRPVHVRSAPERPSCYAAANDAVCHDCISGD